MLALLVAPPLSVDEVLRAVTGVNWRSLGKELIGEKKEYSYSYGRDGDDASTSLDRIHDEHESDEARLRAVVEKFLTKSDRSRMLTLQLMRRRKSQRNPTWRRVIWALYCIHEIDKAQQIRSYAEPLQGMLE